MPNFAVNVDDFWHNDIFKSYVVSSWLGIKFEVHGTRAQAVNFAAYMTTLSNLSPSYLTAIASVGDMGIRVYMAGKIGEGHAGEYSGYKLDSNSITINQPAQWDGKFTLDIEGITASALAKGSNPGGQIIVTIAHELLHAVKGSHAWAIAGRDPTGVAEINNDPMYRATIDLSVDFRLAGVTSVRQYGILAGSLIVADVNIPSRYTINTYVVDGVTVKYYVVGSKTFYVVTKDQYREMLAQTYYKSVLADIAEKGGPRNPPMVFAGDNVEGDAYLSKVAQIQNAIFRNNLAQAGSIVGSSLGNYLAGGDAVKGIV